MSPVRILVLMGSESDRPVMQKGVDVLVDAGIDVEVIVSSAHRDPVRTADLAASAEEKGFSVIICGAGLSAALPGVVAAHTSLPVIGVPLDSSPLKGVDALYSTVQMPGGIPVATMTIGKAGAKNAALFAIQILSRKKPELVERLKKYRSEMKEAILSIEL